MLSGKIKPTVGRRSPTKPFRFCSSARETQLPVFPLPKRSALQTEGAPQLPVTADLPVRSNRKPVSSAD